MNKFICGAIATIGILIACSKKKNATTVELKEKIFKTVNPEEKLSFYEWCNLLKVSSMCKK